MIDFIVSIIDEAQNKKKILICGATPTTRKFEKTFIQPSNEFLYLKPTKCSS